MDIRNTIPENIKNGIIVTYSENEFKNKINQYFRDHNNFKKVLSTWSNPAKFQLKFDDRLNVFWLVDENHSPVMGMYFTIDRDQNAKIQLVPCSHQKLLQAIALVIDFSS